MSKIERRQNSVWYIRDGDEARTYGRLTHHYVHMFAQDLGQQIIPSGIDRDWGLELSIEPADRKVEKILARGFDISQHSGYSHQLAYPLSEFTRLTTAELCDHATATYEIAYLYEEGNVRPIGFELVHLPWYQLRRRLGRVYQLVPAEVAETRKCARTIRLPAETIATFELPASLRKRICAALTTYERVGIGHMSSLAQSNGEKQNPYNFSTHHRSLQLSLMEAARFTGWDARGSYREQVLASYWLKQHIEFLRLSSRVREALLTQINNVVQRTGEKIGYSAKVRLSGFYSDADLDGFHSLIDEGRTPFVKIADKLAMYPNRKTNTTSAEDLGAVDTKLDETGST